ncbi:uracil-DNA glycosylase [Pararhizobium mangrovi]|uniref:Type-4 uracil-DNA glycosylase n=1 Tax=Pararhizobium mangrovi TaxID=2590452 RepID=A0A506U644_9HYPH|nr:uracil-DNA glycosylase [Pararhizobium mangrovi]TPW29862.1 uracil-DNA glycosylase [Pararhizobium mangrovi]
MTDVRELAAAELEAVLRFYADAGVDCMLDDAPVDRFAEHLARREVRPGISAASGPDTASAQPVRTEARPSQAAARQPGTQIDRAGATTPTADRMDITAIPDENAVLDARAAAAEAQTLEDLRGAIAAFEGCNLRHSAKSVVFADGNPKADIMFVGEAPGREEDIQGLPFVGRAGQLFDRMLAAIDLDRTNVYITNMLPWRPPGNRNPTAHEIELCRPFVERHIVLAAPRMIVFLGNIANKALMNTNKGILSMRGTWGEYDLGDRTIPAMPTLHPAYLLRNPAHKRLAWQDLLAIRLKLSDLP